MVLIYHILFIHSSVNGYLDCFHLFNIMNNATINIQVFVWTYMFSFPLGIYIGVELLCHMVILGNYLGN